MTNGNKRLPVGPHQRGAGGAGGGCRRPTLLWAEDLSHTKLIFDDLRLPVPLTCDTRPFWAPLTQLARHQTQTMFPVKVKVEKSGEVLRSGPVEEHGTDQGMRVRIDRVIAIR